MSDNIYIEFADGSWLASLDPMPLFPEEEALYDGQPRTPDGRFDFGRMKDGILSVRGITGRDRRALMEDNYDNALDCIIRQNPPGIVYHHPDIGDFQISKKGLRHALRTMPQKEKTIALTRLQEIISKMTFHTEQPKDGNESIRAVWVGTRRIRVRRHIFKATAFLETAENDGVTRFHHLSLERSKASKNKKGSAAQPEGAL